MGEGKWTRGPWVERTVDGSIGTIETADGSVAIGQAFDIGPADRMNGHTERRANTALFAAAPDMAEALQIILANVPMQSAYQALIHEVLKKANGG